MNTTNKCLAIITARGGSKRIPRKNIRSFFGKPIINYSIESALGASCFDEVMVSTDDHEIADIAIEAGAKVPFFRSVVNSNDFATTGDVINEVLQRYKALGKTFEYCCCIYPTAPFVTAKKLQRAYQLMESTGADSVVPIVSFGFPILRSFRIEDGRLQMNWPEHMNSRSQDLPPAYHDCGQFYFLKVSVFEQSKKLFSDFTVPLEMPESEVQDIDTEKDWKIAELKFKLFVNDWNS